METAQIETRLKDASKRFEDVGKSVHKSISLLKSLRKFEFLDVA